MTTSIHHSINSSQHQFRTSRELIFTDAQISLSRTHTLNLALTYLGMKNPTDECDADNAKVRVGHQRFAYVSKVERRLLMEMH